MLESEHANDWETKAPAKDRVELSDPASPRVKVVTSNAIEHKSGQCGPIVTEHRLYGDLFGIRAVARPSP